LEGYGWEWENNLPEFDYETQCKEEGDENNSKETCTSGKASCVSTYKKSGDKIEVAVKCTDGTYTCEYGYSWKDNGDGTGDKKCGDKGCKKGGSSAKADYSVKLSSSALKKILKKQVQKAYIGVRNADGKWAKLAGFMPFVGKHVQHVALWVGEGKKGVVIEYGDYVNTNFARTSNFFSESGARLNGMSLDKFLQTHEAEEVKVGKVQTLQEMWQEINGKEEWNVQKYDSVTHNCQHFMVAVIKALKLTGTQQSQFPPLVNAQLQAK
jgi:hypothetical protein